MRSISSELLAAIQGDYTPYINLVFHDRDDNNTEDFSLTTDATNRIISIDHPEKMYDGYAFIILRNNDLAIPDLAGWWVEIGYGADTSNFGGSGVEYEKTPRMWVTNQQYISAPGTQIVILILEDWWRRANRHRVISRTLSPHYDFPFTEETVYGILKYLIETDMPYGGRDYMEGTLAALGDQADDIIDSIIVNFDINLHAMESSGGIIQRALNLTNNYLRLKEGLNFEIRYPQTSDSVDATYYSYQVPYFHEFVETKSPLVPNLLIMYGDQDEDGSFENEDGSYRMRSLKTDVAENEEQVVEVSYLGKVHSQGELDLFNLAKLHRLQNRRVGGRMIIRHDPRLELHDRLRIEDSRGL